MTLLMLPVLGLIVNVERLADGTVPRNEGLWLA
jgi:hypothetical protein